MREVSWSRGKPDILLPDGRQVGPPRGLLFGQWDDRASLKFAIEHGSYTGTEIVAHLHNKIAFCRRARDRAGSPWGRFLNWASNEDPDYVPLPGSLLAALFQALGEDDPVDIAPAAEAKLRLDIAETLLDAIDDVLKDRAVR